MSKNKPEESEIHLLKREVKFLRKQNKELDRFVYSASHDLKAPLRSIMGIVGIAKSETTDEMQLRYLGMILRSSSKLDNFINDLVNYSRNARIEIKSEKINLEELFNEILESLSYVDNAKGVQINKSIQVKEIISDTSRIRIICSNLISNAYKYQRKDEKVQQSIKIRVEKIKSNIEISIEDNGEGISTDNQKKIFGMFFRASEQSHGSGLGLYIVREVVKKLKGRIRIESKLGNGSKFIVTLPINK